MRRKPKAFMEDLPATRVMVGPRHLRKTLELLQDLDRRFSRLVEDFELWRYPIEHTLQEARFDEYKRLIPSLRNSRKTLRTITKAVRADINAGRNLK